MLIEKVIGNPEKIKEHNARCDELKLKYPEDGIDWDKQKIEDISDKFTPYRAWLKELTKYATEHGIRLVEDAMIPDNVFVTSTNFHLDIDSLTDYKIPSFMVANDYYCVCDNASQAVERYESLLEEKWLDANRTYLLTLAPIFREFQEEQGGWRYYKWGEYIGVQEPYCEYLYDDKHIDLVYSFHIAPIE